MTGVPLRRVLTAALLAGVCASGMAGMQPAAAQSVPPSAPPAGLNIAMPTVSGILVAKPVQGEGNLPSACRNADQGAVNTAIQLKRGLIVCTTQGNLVLLQLSRKTGIFAKYWGRRGFGRLTDGDHINAWGVLKDDGLLLDPTYAVQDTDLQEAFTDSQDFIMDRQGRRLTLGVLSSEPNSPVKGIVFAVPGGKTSITLCNGQPGRWAALKQGKTIDITNSLFNSRTNTYIHTATVKVVSCP